MCSSCFEVKSGISGLKIQGYRSDFVGNVFLIFIIPAVLMISKLHALYLRVDECRQSSPATTERLFLIKVPNARLYDDMRRMLI